MSETKRPVEESSESQDQKRQKVEVSEQKTEPKGIQESDVGITSYVSKDLVGFVGALKQRYTDFLVNEIDLNDNVIHLTDEGIQIKKPRREQAEQPKETVKEESKEEEKPKEFQLDPAKRISLLETFGEEELTKIEESYRTNTPFSSEKVFDEKKERGQIHQLIREAFQGKFETKTTDKNTFSFTISNRSTRKNKQLLAKQTADENGVENWGLGPVKPFLYFNLYKENKDTMEAASIISRFLRLQPRQIRYAGTKDRRGVTVQKVAISKMKVERVNSLNKTLRGIKLGGFSYEDKNLSLGDLNGNEFLITLRDVKSLDDSKPIEDVIVESITTLKEKGFINYYGMQRFGTFSISTHTIGKEILLSNWKNAAELILSEQELVLPESVEARKIWAETKDPVKTLEVMPRKCIAESTILRHLSSVSKAEDGSYSDNDYFHAINKIPRNLRIMYGHAYQSYVWNSVASERINLFGSQVVVGDLVLEDTEESKDNQNEEDDFEEDVRIDKFQRARAVTQEEVDQGKFTIYDIVLPTPGFDIRYPENEQVLQVYKDQMAKDGLDPLQMTRKVKEFSFAGSYRHLLAKPKNLEYFIRYYEDPIEQLVNTDIDILRLKQKGEENIEQILPNKGGSRVGLVLKLQLDVSAYATMALREAMKVDTSRHGDLCDVKL